MHIFLVSLLTNSVSVFFEMHGQRTGLGLFDRRKTIASYFNALFSKLMGNIPADIALMVLVEKSATSEAELEQNLNIYDICSKKTGKYYILSFVQLTYEG
jgi:hypothetical protein